MAFPGCRQDTNIFDLLTSAGVDPSTISIEIKEASRWGNVFSILGFLLPTLFLIGIFVFMMRQAQGSNNQAMSFGKSRARLFTGNRPTVTFADVAGVDEAKEELVEVVEFLKYPEKFAGARRAHSARRAAGWPARHRQDPAVARGRGRGGRAVLQHLRLRVRGDVRRRRRQPGARPLRPGQAQRALHRLRR